MWFGLIQVVGVGAGWIVGLYFIASGMALGPRQSLGPNATPAEVSTALGHMFQSMSLFMALGIGLGIVGSLLLMLGFRELSKVDRSRFSLPWKFSVVLVIGGAIAAAGLIPLFNSMPDIIAQAPRSSDATAPSAGFFSAVATLVFAGLIASVGGILALVGLIGGEILGLWRIGSKYDETTIKIGAIFEVIPLMNVIAPILVLVGLTP